MSEKRPVANDIIFDHVSESLAAGKRVKLHAKGTSMRPFIRDESDTLIISPVKSLRRGDVVLARTDEGDYVVHRVISLDSERVVLAGDGNLFRRESVGRQSVKGRVDTVIRNGREVSLTSLPARAAALGWHLLLFIRRGMWTCRQLMRKSLSKQKN